MSEIAGKLLRSFISSRSVESEARMQKEEQIGSNQHKPRNSPDMCPDTVKVLETDKSPLKQ